MKKGLLLIAAIIFIAFSSNAQNFTDDFQDDDISNWLTVTPTYASYNTNWHVSMYDNGTEDDTSDDQYYLRASCYADGENHATEQWVISPKLDATGLTSIEVTFDNRKRYAPYQDLEVYVSTDFAGDSASFESATWVAVTGFTLDSDDSDYDWEVGTTGTASITGTATTYIAFKYVSTDDEGGIWDVDNLSVNAPVAETTSVDAITNNTKLFPNPATTILNVASEVSMSNIAVSNVIGQKVLNVNNINANNYQLNLEDLSKGVYLININNVDGTSSVTKFVKK